MFQATVLSSAGLAFSSGWIAGANATTSGPSHKPAGMILESAVGAQRLLGKVNEHFPSVGEMIMKFGFRKKK